MWRTMMTLTQTAILKKSQKIVRQGDAEADAVDEDEDAAEVLRKHVNLRDPMRISRRPLVGHRAMKTLMTK